MGLFVVKTPCKKTSDVVTGSALMARRTPACKHTIVDTLEQFCRDRWGSRAFRVAIDSQIRALAAHTALAKGRQVVWPTGARSLARHAAYYDQSVSRRAARPRGGGGNGLHSFSESLEGRRDESAHL